MTFAKHILRCCSVLFLALAVVWACGFDNSLREYLSARFWLPFAKHSAGFEKPNVRRMSAPFAGMTAAGGDSALAKLRVAYQKISQEQSGPFDVAPLRQAVAAARASQSRTRRETEEIDLIDAKIDLRAGQPEDPASLESASKKLQAFLATARTPEFRSEARGWLARVHYLLGDQTAAGKIYLDELNRNGSNLSRETLLNSLQMNYGYDGGPRLLAHLEEYFDTPEHAAFAIQLATNPHFDRRNLGPGRVGQPAEPYALVKRLLEKHRDLLRSNTGANTLALLAMRTALGAGDPPAARKLAEAVPEDAEIRTEPDFQWMLASALFLSREYAAAEAPLVALFESRSSRESQKAAAAYGLCGVYSKTGNVAGQLRYALWLHAGVRKRNMYLGYPGGIGDLALYWASSGWDLNMLLESEVPIDVLGAFVHDNPELADIRLVQYSLAVRLARENRYQEAADRFASIHALRRAPRMRRLAALYQESNRPDLPESRRQEARYRLAEFLSENPNGVYFNDALWSGLQSYALQASSESRLTAAERRALIESERKLKDDQEERWRAYLILRDVTREARDAGLRRRAAALGVKCLLGINDRFGRQEEIRKATRELSKRARKSTLPERGNPGND